jgi:Nif-specific regulatory protein
VRELQNCVERACVIGKNKWIQKEDLFIQSGAYEEHGVKEGRPLKTALTLFKAYFIQKVLQEHNWNQTETAKALDIQRTYLSRLIKELSIKEN